MNQDKIIIYQTQDRKTSVDVKLEQETVWLTQAQMAELFQKDRTVIGRHINKEGELSQDTTCAKFAHVGTDTDQMLAIVEQYTIVLDLLDDYDHQCISKPDRNNATYILNYEECHNVIKSMKCNTISASLKTPV